MLRSDLYHCHEFVKAVASLLEIKLRSQRKITVARKRPRKTPAQTYDLIEESRRILERARLGDNQYTQDLFDQEFNAEVIGKQKQPSLWRQTFGLFWRFSERLIQLQKNRAVAAIEYISNDVERYYFGKAKEYAAQGIVDTKIGDHTAVHTDEARIEVVDLPSFPDVRTRLLALNSVLATEWAKARDAWAEAVEGPGDEDERVPTFIVVDEAHNLMPSETRGLAADALREQFRTVAAEGRKYGLFLLLCTQRPDKIDPLILSECENQAIMRLGSRSVLKITETLFGLEDIPAALMGKCLEFEIGRALLLGRWANEDPTILYTAMRRTVEDGRSLRPECWAVPPAVKEQGPSKELEVQPAKKTRSSPKRKKTSRSKTKKAIKTKKTRPTKKRVKVRKTR